MKDTIMGLQGNNHEKIVDADNTLLGYQKCKYPQVDPFDPATISYHNNPNKFHCNWNRKSIVENEILRVHVSGIKEVWLYYIFRISDSVSSLSDAYIVYRNGGVPVDADGYLPQKPCLTECGHGGHCPVHCGENGYCCQKSHTDCPANIASEAPSGRHGCTKKRGTYVYYQVKYEFFKVSFTTTEETYFAEYHHAFLKPKNTENNVNDRLNIVMIHLDGISDASVKRTLKKTYSYLTKDENTVIFKQHSIIGDGTTPNMAGILTGRPMSTLPEGRKSEASGKPVDSWPFIFKDLHQKKYETWFVEEDGPDGGTFHYKLRGFIDPPVNHYYRPLWMLLNKLMFKEPLCATKFHFENLRQYFKTYRNYNKYALIILSFLSHDYSGNLWVADDDILASYKFLKDYMNNTVYVLYGDHGTRANSFRYTSNGKIEERFPFLAITYPPWFNKHKELIRNIRRNTDVLTTHFDTYSTLQHLTTFPHANNKTKTKYGLSLFSEDFRKLNRTCSDVSIEPHYCLCLKFESMNTTDSVAQKAVAEVLKYMNTQNEKYAKDKCAKLTLKTFNKASTVQDINKASRYQVMFSTSPSDGMFEATITCTGKGCGVPEISRLNLYGKQPDCIRKTAPRLAKYCYCKTFKNMTSPKR